MPIAEQKITLKNSCNLISKSKDVFSPLKEAITNSLDAISQRKNVDNKFSPEIIVSVYFKTDDDLFKNKEYKLYCIDIIDNGIGFTEENIRRFKDLANNSKGLNNRGTGKIQIYHRFRNISINSIFSENGRWRNLKAEWNLTGEYKEAPLIDIEPQSDSKTIVRISDFYGCDKEEDFFKRYVDNINEFKKDIIKNFLLRLWLENVSGTLNLTISTYINNQIEKSFIYRKDSIPTPDKEEDVLVCSEKADVLFDKTDKNKLKIEWTPVEPKNKLTIQRFKLPCDDMDENGIYLCSKNIVVEAFKFPAIKRKDANFDGYRYITSIKGEIFDNPKNVNQTVDKFMFPSKKEIEKEMREEGVSFFNTEEKYIFLEEIRDKIGKGLSKVYSDVKGLNEDREQDVAKLAKQYGISLEDAEEANISFNDTDDEVVEKLFETQAKRFAKQSIDIQQTYKELKDLETKKLDPTSEEYRSKFSELSKMLLEKIPQQNKDELARYIIRRDMVVRILDYALKNELEVQKEWNAPHQDNASKREKEGIFHDLIFKRRMTGIPNDLWILNEEFVHFDGFSDTPLEDLKIEGEKLLQDNINIYSALASVGISKETYLKQRPDIFLFPEEGKCVLVEFKNPEVDLSEHTTQIPRYAKLIANYSRKPKWFTHFFGFLIGEKIDPINLDTASWRKVPFGNYRINSSQVITSIDELETPIANLYQEMIPFSEIAKRARLRNKSFAEKLGIFQKEINPTDKT